MKKMRILAAFTGLAAMGGGALLAQDARADGNEVQAYGIGNFGGSGQCGSASQTHSVHTSTAAAFVAPFNFYKTLTLWDQVSTHNNSSARGTYWTDPSKSSSGADTALNYGVDEADVVYVHTHGGHTTSAPWRSTLLMGNSSYACNVSTDTNMLFGNPAGGGDLQIAVIKACQSGDYDVWKNGGYFPKFTTSDSVFTVWNAFHGDSSCGGHVTDYVGDYASESFNEGVGENWLDEAYDNAFWPWEDDDCPVSIVMGATKSARQNMYEHGGFRDRKNTGAKTSSTIFYIGGCDPTNGRKLPE